MPRHQLDIQRRGDQLIVVGRHIFRAPQPIAHAPGAKTGDPQGGQASKHLSTGK